MMIHRVKINVKFKKILIYLNVRNKACVALCFVSFPKNYALENDTNFQVSPCAGEKYPNLTWSERN